MNSTDKICEEKEINEVELFPFSICQCDINNRFREEHFHWHESIEVLLVVEGRGKVTVSSKTYVVSVGDIIFVSPEQLHCVEWLRGTEFIYYKISFRGDILLSKNSDLCSLQCILPLLKGQLYLPVYIEREHKMNEKLSACLKLLIKDYFNKEIIHEFFIKSQLYMIFHYIFSENLFVCDVNLILSNSSLQKLKAVILYMEKNYREPINSDLAAGICGFSKSYFMKFFKTCMGMTFVRYLNNYRLSKAAEFLLSSNLSVLEISERVGFENHSYFIRMFKRRYELTPLAFRKKYQI